MRNRFSCKAICLAVITYCLFFCPASGFPGITANTDSITPLKVGDPLPETLWKQPVKLLKTGDSLTGSIVSLEDYRHKAIILDFWASWCSPCVAAFPKMDSLRARFADSIAIIPVTRQDSNAVARFFGNMGQVRNSLPFSVVGERKWPRYFPHHEIPHYVWISADGRIAAITGGDAVNAANVGSLIMARPINVDVKRDSVRKFDFDALFPEEEKARVIMQRTITKHVPGFHPRKGLRKLENSNLKRLYGLNVSLYSLYQMAYSELYVDMLHNSRMKVEIADTGTFTTTRRGSAYIQWAAEHTYCYDLISAGSTEELFRQMRKDLSDYFPYDAAIEKRRTMCWVIRRTGDISLHSAGSKKEEKFDAFSFHGRNIPWSAFVSRLSVYFLQMEPYPVIDESGISGNVDIEIHARLSDPAMLAKALRRYGLDMIKAEREIPVIVVKDRK